jgi:outer membrane protein assembly factor BamB
MRRDWADARQVENLRHGRLQICATMSRRVRRTIAFSFAFFVALHLSAQETNWPQFRGPRGDGTSISTGLPLHWSEEAPAAGIKWKTPIHGRAWSCPVVWGAQVWVTTATEDGRELSVVCMDRDTGKIVRDHKLFDVANPQFAHKFNTYASPTPIIEAGRIYVSFGSPGLACLDTQTGKVLWTRRDFECNHYRGAGSSPILQGDLLILNFDGSDHQFVVALDKNTGRTAWQKNRSVDHKDLDPDGKVQSEGDFRKAFATCQIAVLDGQTTLLSQGAKAFYAYDPLTGEELWRVEERTSHSGATRPVIGHGLVFYPSGFSQGFVLAIRPGKKGEVLDVSATLPPETQLQVAWKAKKSVPKKPSLLLIGELLFGIDDNGVATCWEAKTGRVVWNERIGGNYSAAPIAAEGRIYFFSEEGKTTVIAADREFKKLAENQLGDGFMASPAVSGNALFLRSRTNLYRVEE